jgi:hypothetical protein
VNDFDTTVVGPLVDVRLAVGDDDHLLAVQVAVQGLFESLRRPVASFAVALLLGDDPVHQIPDVAEDGLELGPLSPALQKRPHLPAPASP